MGICDIARVILHCCGFHMSQAGREQDQRCLVDKSTLLDRVDHCNGVSLQGNGVLEDRGGTGGEGIDWADRCQPHTGHSCSPETSSAHWCSAASSHLDRTAWQSCWLGSNLEKYILAVVSCRCETLQDSSILQDTVWALLSEVYSMNQLCKGSL